MNKRITLVGFPAFVAATVLLASCSRPLGPERNNTPGLPRFSLGAPGAPGLDLDQWNGSLNESSFNPGTCDGNNPCFIKGFNPQNPQNGDAIIATFFWVGSRNIITSVTDRLSNGAPVGNTYTLVEYVTAGGISMATYAATNVRNFPDAYSAPSGDSILVVQADLSSPVTDG